MILVQSNRGMLTALDAETGRTLWATQVGSRNGASTEPAANDTYVVVLNGSTLYVVNRSDGSIAWETRVGGAPGAGPGVTDTHVFVPMVSGRVEGYSLEDGPRQEPWNYQSTGRVLMPPMTTKLTVSWTTEKGYFYVADPSAKGIRYRLETEGEIQSRPASWGTMLFASSTDGFVYGIEQIKGNLKWKQSLGEAVYDRPVAVDGKLFITAEFGGMYCLDTADGSILWHVAGVRQFVASSGTRIYATDLLGRLAILDAESGGRLASMPLSATTTKLTNAVSDRIFVVDNGCVVQCLHELQLTQPLIHTPPEPTAEDLKLAPTAPAGTPPSAAEAPDEAPMVPADEGDSPFAAPADAGDNPFAPPADAGDSPFGSP